MKNPFLNSEFIINWAELKPQHVVPDMKAALKAAQADIDAITGSDRVSFEDTILALENSRDILDEAWAKILHLDTVCNSDELREAINEILPEVTDFYSRIPLNAGLWEKIKQFSETEECRSLAGTKKRLFEEIKLDFLESGANLKPEKKEELFKLEKELAQATKKFSENMLDALNAYELVIDDQSKLKGLPESAIAQAKQMAEEKGKKDKWLFTLHVPSVLPVLKFLNNEAIRKEMFEELINVGNKDPYNNTALIWQILELRSRKAELLGYDNFADYILKRRMAESGDKAMSFTDNLHKRILDKFRSECRELEEYRALKKNIPPEPVEPWERNYWSEKMRQEKYEIDEEELRPYYSINNVISGMFSIAEKLYSIKIEEVTDLKPEFKWHKDVKYYNIHDNKNRHLGSFYADWHPRSSKRSGAWMEKLRTGGPGKDGKFNPHIGVICGNLTPGIKDKPALLTHAEVETIFHEFGHLLHQIFGEVEYKSLNGTNVAWDFVELPSQIMENWCWEKESLDIFAKHYSDGNTIPEQLFNKMIKARHFQTAINFMRQLSLGKMDLDLHINYKKHKGKDLDLLLETILKDYKQPQKSRYPEIIRQFGHLFSESIGYAAGYYSYKWAEVLDADAFTQFKQKGILNPEAGNHFRETILKNGKALKASELYYNFMGRDPDISALLKRSGL